MITLCAVMLASAPGTADWSGGTAYILPEGRREVGLFAPLRHGRSERVEIFAQPLLELLAPNLGAKIRWRQAGDGVVSTRHSIIYPTGIFAAIARGGTGGILPEESRIPHIVATTNEVLYTTPFAGAVLTANAAATLAARVGEMDFPSIDLPVIYPRMAAYRRGWSLNAGVDLRAMVTSWLGFQLDADAFLLSTKLGRWAVEHGGIVVVQPTDDFRVLVGYRVVYGEYPGGVMLNLGDSLVPLPILDLVWGFD